MTDLDTEQKRPLMDEQPAGRNHRLLGLEDFPDRVDSYKAAISTGPPTGENTFSISRNSACQKMA